MTRPHCLPVIPPQFRHLIHTTAAVVFYDVSLRIRLILYELNSDARYDVNSAVNIEGLGLLGSALAGQAAGL
jgi:hypothetical protein